MIESPAFEVIMAKDKFDNPIGRVNEMWQTNFTQFLLIDWVWYYLSTVLDDYSRCILGYKLSPIMNEQDAEDTLKVVLAKASIPSCPKTSEDIHVWRQRHPDINREKQMETFYEFLI